MANKIILPLSKDWKIESDVQTDEGVEVACFYATAEKSKDPSIKKASIELYVGPTPEGSDAKQECIGSYMEAIGAEDGEDIPVSPIPFLGSEGWYYDAVDDEDNPVILICSEIRPGTLVLAILANRDEESLDDLMSYVDENLSVE